MDLVVFTYEQTKTLFLITEEEALVLALQAPKEYEVPPPTRILRVCSSFVREWANHNRPQRYLRQCREYEAFHNMQQRYRQYQDWR